MNILDLNLIIVVNVDIKTVLSINDSLTLNKRIK